MARIVGSSLRVLSLNLCAYFRTSPFNGLAQLIASHEPDIALLQECRRGWLDAICEAAGLEGVHSHDAPPEQPRWPRDGCAVAVRPPLQIDRTWRIPGGDFQPEAVRAEIDEETPPDHEVLPERLACRYSARTLLAELVVDARSFVACSFHASPGTGKVGQGSRTIHEWKPFFHGAVALELSRTKQPFIFGIDANEPLSETLEAIDFHWEEGRPGALKLDALLGIEPRHRARDLLRESLLRSGRAPAGSDHLALTHTIRGGGKRRFDQIWATPEFDLEALATYYDEALAAGTDHALVVAEVRF